MVLTLQCLEFRNGIYFAFAIFANGSPMLMHSHPFGLSSINVEFSDKKTAKTRDVMDEPMKMSAEYSSFAIFDIKPVEFISGISVISKSSKFSSSILFIRQGTPAGITQYILQAKSCQGYPSIQLIST